ncbi:tripartite motif-containing protein 54-like [Mizuhopecten yessoensis]|uniref:Tripartite motif-containing protein 2 n=1 Tax=Mizuhopecten yessoensis TaxID=6573 RepID=A0A210QU70_MIZYE|nr:tripartite motif-containing protein 54-like [Mizuhopecten yessoensis]OWF52298.1 Tripartite motif-containing protein 2 [Mizuhopecten yessoensis]
MASVEDSDGESTKVLSPLHRSAEELEKQFHLLKSFGGSTSSVEKRNIFLEEERFLETFLRCLICRELYDLSDRPPKILPCHHSLCLQCTLKLYQGEVDYHKGQTHGFVPVAVSIVCPTCRKHFISQEEGLRQLPTDHRVIQLIDFVRNTDVQIIQYCTKHQHQHLNFFCEHCCYLVCRDCTILDHKESDGHIVLDIDTAVNKYVQVLDNAMAELQSQNTELKEKRVTVEKAIDTMTRAEEGLTENIRESFNRLRELLEEREKELLGMAALSVNTEKEKLKEKIVEIEDRCKVIDEKCEELQSAKAEKNVDKLYKAQEETKTVKEMPAIGIEDVDSCIQTQFSFNDRDEKYLSTRIKNYGEVDSCTQIETTKPASSSTSTYSSSYAKYGSATYGGSTSYNRYNPSSYSTSSVYGYGSGKSYYRP